MTRQTSYRKMAGDVRQLDLSLLLLLFFCSAVFIKVSVSVFSNQRRRVGAAFSGPGRCIVESKGGAGCLLTKKKEIIRE